MSSIGGLAGAPFGSLGMGIGSLAGSLLGGLFGGKEKEDEEVKQTQHLASIKENTQQLVDRLSPEIFNAPASFTLPSSVGFGGGITITNNISTSGGAISPSGVSELEDQLNEIYSRSTKRFSYME